MIAVLFALSLTVQTPAPAPPLTPEQTLQIRGVSDPQVSPDGRRVAFVVTEPPEGTERNRDVWMVTVATREVRRLTYTNDGRVVAALVARRPHAGLPVEPRRRAADLPAADGGRRGAAAHRGQERRARVRLVARRPRDRVCRHRAADARGREEDQGQRRCAGRGQGRPARARVGRGRRVEEGAAAHARALGRVARSGGCPRATRSSCRRPTGRRRSRRPTASAAWRSPTAR